MPHIVVVNASQVLSDASLRAYVKVMQSFDDEVLRPAWNLDKCAYSFETWRTFHKQFPSPPKPADGIWPIFINNRSDQAGALGWHDDSYQGKTVVFGRVFAGDCKRYKINWRTDLTHEAWELRGDPNIDQTAVLEDGREAAVELCDPVEDDAVAIKYKHTVVSNFVLPSYFRIGGVSPPYDYGRFLALPCPSLTPGGYQSLYVDGQWTQVTARLADGTIPYRALRPGRSFKRAGGKI